MSDEEPWYAERRARWKPEHVRLLLIAESAPDDGGDIANRRFFYDDNLTRHDGLFREVVKALFAVDELKSGPDAKRPWLERLRDAGVYLTDLAPSPVNYSSPSERDAILAKNIEAAVDRILELGPDGVVLVKKNVFEHLQGPLLAAGQPLLHDEFIPFPGSGQQKRFRERFLAAAKRLPV